MNSRSGLVLSVWPESHEHGKPCIGVRPVHVRAQDRAVSHRHIGILFHKHFIPAGHCLLPPAFGAESDCYLVRL